MGLGASDGSGPQKGSEEGALGSVADADAVAGAAKGSLPSSSSSPPWTCGEAGGGRLGTGGGDKVGVGTRIGVEGNGDTAAMGAAQSYSLSDCSLSPSWDRRGLVVSTRRSSPNNKHAR